MLVIVMLESSSFTSRCCCPEEHLIQAFPPSSADQPFNEGMR